MTQLTAPTHHHVSCTCPLCGALAIDVQYEVATDNKCFPQYKCDFCGGLFIRPMLINQIDERKMDSLEDAELLSPVFKKLHEKLILKKEVRAIRSIFHQTQFELLDIGCGSGWSTDFWQRNGAKVEAVEPSMARCEYARRQYGLTVHNCYVEELDLPGKFDVVVLRHILEHLEHPTKILNSVHKLLKDDGVILLVVPNIDCIGRKIFGRFWEWVLPWHCNFFTPKSVIKLIELCGFDAVTTYQSPSPLYYGESVGRALYSRVLEGFFTRHRLAGIPIALPLALIGLLTGSGDNITLIARKVKRVYVRPSFGKG